MSTSKMRTLLTNLKTLIATEFLADESLPLGAGNLPRIPDVSIRPVFDLPGVYPCAQLTDGTIEDAQDDARSAVYVTVMTDDPDPERGMLDLLDLVTDLKSFIAMRFARLCAGVEDYDLWSSDPQYQEIAPSEGQAAAAPVIHWRTLRLTPLWLED